MEGINKNKNINKILIAIGCIVIAIILSIGTKNIISYASKDMNEEKPHGAEVVDCSSGQYRDGQTCRNCPVGYRCNGETRYACLAGTYASGGASVCTTCQIGYYCPGATTRLTCPAGYYCPTTGMTNGEVNKCPPGYYCPGGTITPEKTPCPTGTTSEAGAKSEADCKSTSPSIADVKLICGINTMKPGGTRKCYTTVDGSNVTTGLEYSSTNDSVATIDSSGNVKALQNGQVTFSVNYSNNGKSGSSTFTMTIICDAGEYYNFGECITCPAGFYCSTGLNATECPNGTSSSAGADSSDDCTSVDIDKCNLSVSITSKHVSVDEDDKISNSYYEVTAVVEGEGCKYNTLKYSATNFKTISPVNATIVENTTSYKFKVYPKDACTESSATATLSNGKKDTVTISAADIYHDWDITDGCWTKETVGNAAIGSLEADSRGENVYYDNYNETKQCYTIYATRMQCGPSAPPSTPTEPENPSNPTVEQDACYMNNATGIYTWGKHKNDSNYTLMPDLDTSDKCNIPPEGGTGNEDPVYACYKDANNNYKWAVTPPAGYTLVESIREEVNCKLIDNAACYIDSSNKYVWGDYASSNSHKLVDSIKTADKCVNPAACYKDKNDNYVWGNYSYNSSYSLVSNITKKEDCKKTVVNVPSTAASVSTIIYISIAIMTIAGGSFIYYVYNKKNLNTK